jgi:hypothetical protein
MGQPGLKYFEPAVTDELQASASNKLTAFIVRCLPVGRATRRLAFRRKPVQDSTGVSGSSRL